MLRRRDKRGDQRYISACHVLASITLSHCSSRILLHRPSTLYHSFPYLDLFHDTPSYLLGFIIKPRPSSILPRSFVQGAEIPWLDLWKRAIQGRAPWLFTSQENYNGEFQPRYKCLMVNNSSWGKKKSKKKKEKKLSPDIPLYLVGKTRQF